MREIGAQCSDVSRGKALQHLQWAQPRCKELPNEKERLGQQHGVWPHLCMIQQLNYQHNSPEQVEEIKHPDKRHACLFPDDGQYPFGYPQICIYGHSKTSHRSQWPCGVMERVSHWPCPPFRTSLADLYLAGVDAFDLLRLDAEVV